jgi:hypothetical protein
MRWPIVAEGLLIDRDALAIEMPDRKPVLCHVASWESYRPSRISKKSDPWRPLIIPPLPPLPAQTPPPPAAHTRPSPKPARSGARCRYRPWAELMRLTLGLPVDTCPHCGGRMRLRALVRDPDSIERFLRHQGLWTEPLGLAQARPPPYFRSATRLRPSPQVELFE